MSLESLKNIACVHCNLNKISHKEVFFLTYLNSNMTFKHDNNFGTEGVPYVRVRFGQYCVEIEFPHHILRGSRHHKPITR